MEDFNEGHIKQNVMQLEYMVGGCSEELSCGGHSGKSSQEQLLSIPLECSQRS